MSKGTLLAELERARADGATRDDLLRTTVRRIEAADPRYDWVGIYLLEEDTLVLHSYVGRPTEHAEIPVGVGVCGAAIAEGRDMNVPDVRAIENYLACSLETRSELVILIQDRASERIFGQIDLDSDRADAFTAEDERTLQQVADWLATLFV
ncbi:MAG: GAF domain-containing protein [Gemmatimonadetes bacterium]|nr:GAF domain-containing protein [Gemmatimonadota bacterium]